LSNSFHNRFNRTIRLSNGKDSLYDRKTMSIKLIYLSPTPIPVEIEGLTPEWTCDKSLAEIERFEIFHGNRRVALGELFDVSGDPADKRIDFEGDLSGVHWIGAHMRSGQIYVNGPAGRHAGSEMRGGVIRIDGDAGGWLGCEMRGGLIHVRGNAGHLVGGAYRGSAKGMQDGTILVDGNAGNEIGLSMQQGVIAIGGRAGDVLGFNMKDGTIIVLGEAGIRAGAAMRGGTIALLGPSPPPILPSFRFDHTTSPEKLASMFHELHAAGLRWNQSTIPSQLDLYIGDLVEDGAGELLSQHVR
jgi:formylmethanofuran dehydrogenase subunit C